MKIRGNQMESNIDGSTFDFLEYNLFIRTSEGTTRVLPLIPRSVAAFCQEFMACLHALGIQITINPCPAKCRVPFAVTKTSFFTGAGATGVFPEYL